MPGHNQDILAELLHNNNDTRYHDNRNNSPGRHGILRRRLNDNPQENISTLAVAGSSRRPRDLSPPPSPSPRHRRHHAHDKPVIFQAPVRRASLLGHYARPAVREEEQVIFVEKPARRQNHHHNKRYQQHRLDVLGNGLFVINRSPEGEREYERRRRARTPEPETRLVKQEVRKVYRDRHGKEYTVIETKDVRVRV